MRTLTLLKKLPVWLLGACLCMGTIPTAYAVGNLGLFELEGNALDESGLPLPDDWETLCDPDTVPGGICADTGGDADVFTGINNDPDLSSIFDGGKKDIQDVSEWSHKDGAVPDKDDITNAYAAAYTSTTSTALHSIGDLIIYFGSDRIDASGDAFMGYWFFQDDVQALPDGTFSGNHINGDVLVVTNYPQSNNAVPLIKVIEWDDTCTKAASNNPLPSECAAKNLRLLNSAEGANARCLIGGADQLACAISNTEASSGGLFDPTDSPWAYISKDGHVNEFPGETFLEGGINLSKLLPDTTGCFSSFMAETRSSSSFTATLKDFRLDSFELCGIAATKACEATLSDAGDEVSVAFDGTVSNTGARALTVTLSDSLGDITAVCYNVNGDPDACDGGDTLPANLSFTDGVAEFDLLGGETVRFEGTYLESNPVFDEFGTFTHEDTVTVTATLFDGETDVVDTTADADCETTGTPGVEIDKFCSAVTSGGTDLVVSISGMGSNNGQIKLLDVEITDSEGATITEVLRDDTPDADADGIGDDGVPETEVTNGAFDLLPGQAYSYTGTLTIEDAATLEHSDTVTVSGTNFFDQEGDAVEDTSELAECSADIDPGIAVTKVCDVLLEAQAEPARIVLKVDFSGTVTNTGDVELTNVSVEDDLAGVVLSGVTLAPGASQNYSGSYYPSVGAGQPVPTASELSASDTVNASGTGAFGVGIVNKDSVANGEAPAEISATCYLCDDDDDMIPDVLDPDSGPVVP